MILAKLSTAITIPFGPVLDSTGAEFTTLVVGEVKICKNNGTPAALNGSATLTHKEVGVYELVLTTSDISVVGQATLSCSKTTYVAPPVHLAVLPAKVYDSLVGGTDNLEIDVIQLLGTAWLAPGTAGTPDVALTSVYDPAKTAAQAGDEMALTSAERTTLAEAIWNALTSGMVTVGSIGKKLADWTIHSAADVWAVATRVLTAGTNIALAKGTGVTGFTDLDAGGVRTAVGMTAANLDTQIAALPTDADVNAQCDQALSDYDGPTYAELVSLLAAADDAILAAMITERNKIADHVLRRNQATAAVSADGDTVQQHCLLNAARKLDAKVAVVGGNLVTYAEDGTTPAMTQALTTDAAADPITGVGDPT